MRGRSRQKQSESRPGQHHQTQVKTPSLAAARARAGIRRRTRIVMSKAPTRSRQTRMERMSPLSVHVRVLFVHSLLYRSMWNSRLCSTKREKIIQPAPRMHCPSTRTNERTNQRTRYLTHCPSHRASWAVRFHSREEDNAPSHSRSRSHSHACMHTYLRLSVSLSLSLSVRARIVLRGFPFGQTERAQVFHSVPFIAESGGIAFFAEQVLP